MSEDSSLSLQVFDLKLFVCLFVCFFFPQTPMISYVNVHAILDGRRNRAKASSSDSSNSNQVLVF